MGLANNLFNEIYDKLVVYHQQNDVFIVDKKDVKAKTINKLKKILINEHINFTEDEDRLLCYLTKSQREIAKNIYTTETVKKLEEEERRVMDYWLYEHF